MRLFVDGVRRFDPGSVHLGHLFSPATGVSSDYVRSLTLPWAADNGCFKGLKEPSFLAMLDRIESVPGCVFVVAPDRVGDAARTRELFDAWQPRLAARGFPLAYVAQNGQEDFDPPWDLFRCLFVGGVPDGQGYEWKEGTAAATLIREAKRRGKWVHMGRVNTFRRMKIAHDAGCDSFDGSKHSKFPDTWIPETIRWLEELGWRPPAGWKGIERPRDLFTLMDATP